MDPVWLVRNTMTSWRHRASLTDFARRLRWIYAAKLGQQGKEWTIGFRYPRPIGDIRLLVRANAGSDAFIHSEVFEHQYYRLPLTEAPSTILDLGANIGLSAIFFSRLFPGAELACVEPVPDNVSVLRRNLELNGVRATVVPAAIDPHDGHALIELDPMDYGHRVVAAGEHASACLDVATISVPTLCRQMAWDRIGLLKVDIEGHEKVLFGGDCGWLTQVDAMCIECHTGFFEDADLLGLAERHGFRTPERLPGIWFMDRPVTADAV